jgi:hypothetical protein
MDILEGDRLVVGSKEYPIKACEEWDRHRFGSSASYARMATVACSTKRNPAISVTGNRGDPVTNLTGLVCTPLDPGNAEISQRPGTHAPEETLRCIISDGTDFVQLTLEDLKI